MSDLNQRVLYQYIAILLQYPDEDFMNLLPELKNEINRIQDSSVKNELHQLIDKISNTPLEQLVEHYIEHFDFGRTTNLYVTYFHSGEGRERGLELLKLKQYYERYGFEITDEELPDYLPLMLEFCANVPIHVSNELLEQHVEALQLMRDKLVESGSLYAVLLNLLMTTMYKNGVSTRTDA